MSNTWISADHHLGDPQLELRNRPFRTVDEMVNIMIDNHNQLVSPGDHVIFNGDVCYGKAPEYIDYISKFNGIKVLIRGNQERPFSDSLLCPYFQLIIDEGKGLEMEIGGIKCYITHYPTLGKKDRFNLVGHVHAAWKYQLNMINVGVDVHHFRPININTIPYHMRTITDFYDDDVWAAYNSINSDWQHRHKTGSYFPPTTSA